VLAGEAVGVVELQPEGGDERRVVGGRDVVRRDPAAGEEAAEVDRRAVDLAVAPAGPLDLRDLLAAALGGLRDRLGLRDAWVEGGDAVVERLAVDVEGVVRRAVDAGPGARGEGVPAGAGVGGRLGEQPAASGR